MLDIGWTELFVIGIVALIVIGPKDLPGALNTFGKYVGQLRRMVRQFQDGIQDIAHQEELRELRKSINEATDTKTLDRYLDSDIDDAAKPVKTAAAVDNADANSIAPPEAPAEDSAMPAEERTMEPPGEAERRAAAASEAEPAATADAPKPSSTTAST
jgi:sec-independent protein translocase protein TatB